MHVHRTVFALGVCKNHGQTNYLPPWTLVESCKRAIGSRWSKREQRLCGFTAAANTTHTAKGWYSGASAFFTQRETSPHVPRHLKIVFLSVGFVWKRTTKTDFLFPLFYGGTGFQLAWA